MNGLSHSHLFLGNAGKRHIITPCVNLDQSMWMALWEVGLGRTVKVV